MRDLCINIDDGILNIRVGAIIMKDGKLLMAANKAHDYYYSVGGRIKFGETAEQAVKREVLEETGTDLEIARLGFVHENFFVGDISTNMGKKIYEISFYFYMQVPENFEPVCKSFTEDGEKEYLEWVAVDSDKTYYPEFLRTELKNITNDVKHFVTKDC